MATAVIVDAVRTAGGKRNGKLSGWHPADLAAEVLKALAERNDLDPALVDDVIMGCVMQVGSQGLNVGRNAVLAAGWPESVPATTVDRQCGSSQQSAHFAAQGVIAGAYDVVVAAGVEVMTTTPMGASVTPGSFPFGPKVIERYAEVGGLVPQGISAELIADKWGLSREDLDAFGAQSQQRAAQATDEGRFDNEIIPVQAKPLDKETGKLIETDEIVTADEGIRPGTTAETLAKLKPAFKPDGKVTAGNSSQITDGASAVLIMSEEKAKELGLTPRARFHTFALAGVDPVTMLTGPIPSTTKVLEKSGLSIDDIDLFEINEAFASVVLAWEKEHHPDMEPGQRERRRHRPRPPARLLRHQAHGHAAQRARAHRRPLRPPDHVRGRRPGQRHDHRAPGLIPFRDGAARRRPMSRQPAPSLNGVSVWTVVRFLLALGVGRAASLRVGMAFLGGLSRPVPEPPPAGRAAQGQAHLPLQHLRHRGAHDRGQRRDARAARGTAWRTWTSSPRWTISESTACGQHCAASQGCNFSDIPAATHKGRTGAKSVVLRGDEDAGEDRARGRRAGASCWRRRTATRRS